MLLRRLLLLLALLPLAAAAADYAREKKWADEILPGVVVGDPVWLEADGRKFLGLLTESASPAKAGLVLLHGIGVHPDWALIGALRTGLADAGFTTLSIQMPVLAADAKAEDYAPTFPEAAARVAAAVRYLQGRGQPAPVLVAHSLGARMANEYLARHSDSPVAAYVAIGLSGPLPQPLPAALRILDIHGSADLPQVLEGVRLRKPGLDGRPFSRQFEIADADHFFAGAEPKLVRAIELYLQEALAPR